jgi:hypothetical protein
MGSSRTIYITAMGDTHITMARIMRVIGSEDGSQARASSSIQTQNEGSLINLKACLKTTK